MLDGVTIREKLIVTNREAREREAWRAGVAVE
jgi:hypothetical protein